MFSEPVSISVGQTVTPSGGTAKSLARIRSDGYASEYQTSDGLYGLKITHTRGNRVRSEARLDFFTQYTDPSTGLERTVSASAYLVLNRPPAGFTTSDLTALVQGVCGWAGTTAVINKLLALES